MALNYISSNHYDLQKRNLRFMLLLSDELKIYFFGGGNERNGASGVDENKLKTV